MARHRVARRPMRPVKLALVLGLVAVAVAIGATLAHAPTTVARTNKPSGQPEEPVASAQQSTSYCQPNELLPRGTTALRVWLDAAYGPRVAVEVSVNGHRLTGGSRGSGWVGGSVTVPVTALSHAAAGVTVCISFQLRDETIVVQGSQTPTAGAVREDGQPLAGRMWIEYLRPGQRSWASLLASTARHMALGRAAGGIWVVFAALGLLAAVVVLAGRLVLRELR
jgi:hypothetical protein